MSNKTSNHFFNRKTIFKILEAIFCLTCLFLSLRLLDLITFDKKMFYFCVAMFITAALSDVSKALSYDISKKTDRILHFLYASLYSLAGLIILLVDSKALAIKIVSMIVVIIFTISRMNSVIRRHEFFHIIFFIIFLILMISWVIYILDDTPLIELILFLVLILTMMSLMLIKIIAISLSRLKYELLLKIARKSMAGQILSGLIILIIAFSFILTSLDPGITSYSDALWYCFAIVTTIGFGDITATTGLGRVLSVILGIYGIIVVALITSIIVNFYTEVKDDDSSAKQSPTSLPQSEQEEQNEIP